MLVSIFMIAKNVMQSLNLRPVIVAFIVPMERLNVRLFRKAFPAVRSL